MINVDAFFSGTLNTVDAVIGHFVNEVYVRFVSANAGVISLLFTLYIMFLGLQFLYHTHHFDLSVVTRRLIVMLCVYGMVMNWHLYNLFVYRIFTIEPGNIAQVMINAAGSQTESIAQGLDSIYSTVMHITAEFFGQLNFSFSAIAFLIYGLLVLFIGTFLCVFALLLFIYAKMMMAVALALGPIFILCFLWDSTKGLFSAWLNKLITIALIPIVTSAILVLMLSVIHVTLPGIHQPTENLQFYGIAPFLGLTLTTTLILSQVFRICSALGGGITLASLSHGVAIASATWEKTGAKAATLWAGNKAKNVSRRLFKGG